MLQSLDGRIELLVSRSAVPGYDPTEKELDLEEITEIEQLKAEIVEKISPITKRPLIVLRCSQ